MKAFLKFIKYSFLIVLMLITGFCVFNWRNDISVDELKKKYANAESEFIEIDNMQVHYRDEGNPLDSIPIVLIHGTGASLHTWEVWVQELKKEYRVITLDLPAYGLTGSNTSGNYSLKYYSGFMEKFLSKLNIKHCVLGGNSLGGAITWEYALAHPGQVDKMVLVDAGGYPTKSKSVPIAFQLAKVPVINNLFKYILPRSVVEKSLKNIYFHEDRITPELVNRYFDLALREGNRKAFLDKINDSSVNNDYLKINTLTMPALIIWGDKDELIPLDVAEKFHNELPNDTLIIFKELGHTPMEEDPQTTIKAVKYFLSQKRN
jgi:pimeloyl-ACP methyl ester carboxylesterase